jgi:hypothetical protein
MSNNLNDRIKELASAFSFHDSQVFIYDTPFAMILPENGGFLCLPCATREFERGNYTRSGHDRVEAKTPEELDRMSDAAYYEKMNDLLHHILVDHIQLGRKPEK